MRGGLSLREAQRSYARALDDPLQRVGSRLDAFVDLMLLDRIAAPIPGLDLGQRSITWITLVDGHEALLVNGGGVDGGSGAYVANGGDDLNGFGSFAPLASLVGAP